MAASPDPGCHGASLDPISAALDGRLAALREGAQRVWPEIDVEWAASVPSTNDTLLQRYRSAGAGGTALRPCLLVADAQTQGRGRMGRAWTSRPGDSLTFSLAFEPARGDLAGLSLAVGVALADALEPLAPGQARGASRLRLKWPNDLWLLDGAGGGSGKLGGVLIETLFVERRRVCVLGVGLNVRPLVRPGADDALTFAWACLQELEPAATVAETLERVVPSLLRALDDFGRTGFAASAAAFQRRDLLAGHLVQTTGAAAITGRAQGVDAEGALQVRDEHGMLHRILSGEVSVRPCLDTVQPTGELAC